MVGTANATYVAMALAMGGLGCELVAGIEDRAMSDPQPAGGAGGVPLSPCSGDGPVELATQQLGAYGVAVWGGYVYWTSNSHTPGSVPGAVLRRALSAGATPETLSDDEAQPNGLAVDASGVYWVANASGALRHCSHDGRAVAAHDVTVGPAAPDVVVLDDVYAYWSTHFGKRIARVPKAGAAAPDLSIDVQDRPNGVAIDADTIYWTDTGAEMPPAAIARASKSGDAVTVITVPPSAPFCLWVDDQYVYWTSDNAGPTPVRRAPKTAVGGVAGAIGGDEAPSRGITGDDEFVYFSTTAGEIIALNKQNEDRQELANGQLQPQFIAVDESCVYWANRGLEDGTGAVMTVAKPR
jgi:sugar lactone lactonase YvrE